MRKAKFLAEVKECLFLAVPLAGIQLAEVLTAFVDTVMMGMLGNSSLAAGGLGSALILWLLMVGTGIISAVSPLAAEAYGGGKTQKVSRVVNHGFWLCLAIAIPVTLLIWNGDVLLRVSGQAEDNLLLATGYLKAISWGFLPGLGFAVLKNFASALSLPQPVTIITIVGAIINIFANYVLMFGKLGFPALGLAGIGCSSTFTLWSIFFMLAMYVTNHKVFKPYNIFHNLHLFDWRIFWVLLQTGLPIGVLTAVETGVFTATTFMMGKFGNIALASHQIILQTSSMTFMISVGISIAITIRVGQMVGRCDGSAASLCGYVGIGITSLFMAMMAILFWTIPETIISFYIDVQNPDNVKVVANAKSLLRVVAVYQLADGIQLSAVGALRGLKDTRFPMFVGIVSYWFVGLGSGYFLGFQFALGAVGLWCGLAIGLIFAATILSLRFYRLHKTLLSCL